MRGLCLLLGLVALVPSAFADDGAAGEDLRRWKQFVRLSGPLAEGKLTGVTLTPAVFGGARQDLGDLRLIDGKGQPVPYALRVLEGRHLREGLPDVKAFDRVALPEGGERLTLDLGERTPEHNEIQVAVGAVSYGRPLVVESSNDGKAWATLLDKAEVVNLQRGGQSLTVDRFTYPPSRQRYLRVTLRPDKVEKDAGEVLQAANVGVYHSVEQPGRMTDLPAGIDWRDPGRQAGDYSTSWVLDLGDDNVPVSRLTLAFAQEQFSRPFLLETFESGQPGQLVVQGTLRRKDAQEGPTTLRFQEVKTRRLKLTVIDSRNPPLTLNDARYGADARLLVFRVPPGATELSLYLDNPEATDPRYDFGATLPRPLGEVKTLEASARQPNPAYVPPPERQPPWTERYPYLLDGVLLAALAVLVWLLAVLARTAIRRHDAATA